MQYVSNSSVKGITTHHSIFTCIACWLRHFVSEFESPAHKRTLTQVDMDDVLEGCLRNPNYYTRLVLQSISVVDPELGQSIKPFTRYIDQMIMKSINEKAKKDNIPQIDEQALEKEMKELEAQLSNIKSAQSEREEEEALEEEENDKMDIDGEEKEEKQEPSWKLYENWKPCPIGTLPNGKVPNLDMATLVKSSSN